MINELHYERSASATEQARARGLRVIVLTSAREDWSDRSVHKIPPHLVVDPGEDSKLMQEEIFGPVRVIKPYRELGRCIDYVNARPRPLALYWFGVDEAERERVLRE